MYQSNQERIKKEKPSLLPGHGQTPRGRLSLALAALAREHYPWVL
jgi:glyoxylase-like metal-dependent hydrolase (beta-lactamase superfamily II)